MTSYKKIIIFLNQTSIIPNSVDRQTQCEEKWLPLLHFLIQFRIRLASVAVLLVSLHSYWRSLINIYHLYFLLLVLVLDIIYGVCKVVLLLKLFFPIANLHIDFFFQNLGIYIEMTSSCLNSQINTQKSCENHIILFWDVKIKICLE